MSIDSPPDIHRVDVLPDIALYQGDSRHALTLLPEDSVHLCLTDPPYGLTESETSTKGFMGLEWDGTGIERDPEFWKLVYRVLKPGGWLLSFAATRTYHRMACAIEDAGFEIRDMFSWLYSSGMPHGLDVSKSIDKKLGATRTPVRTVRRARGIAHAHRRLQPGDGGPEEYAITEPATPEARRWDGWNSVLKPAQEPICIARKPIPKGTSLTENVLRHGTGAINIRGGAIPDRQWRDTQTGRENAAWGGWPHNVALTHAPECGDHTCVPHCPAAFMNAQALIEGEAAEYFHIFDPLEVEPEGTFYYCPKPNDIERDAGCDAIPKANLNAEEVTEEDDTPWARGAKMRHNNHPTVKPIALMRHYIRLFCPEGGLVLDPFNGSGSTGCAAAQMKCQYIGMEMDERNIAISKARIRYWHNIPSHIDKPRHQRKQHLQVAMEME